jgi:hypothetical protein
MLVNYKEARVLTAEAGQGKPKLVLVPGVNVVDDAQWEAAKGSLSGHITRGVIVPIYKVEKEKVKDKDGKEKQVDVEKPCSPDEIPADKLDAVVNEIKSEAQAEKFEKASTKEVTRVKAMNRKAAIAKEVAEQGK